MKMSLMPAVLAIFLGTTATVRPTTYYVGVGPKASDANAGTSALTPFSTPQHAADIANPGDTVLFLSGTYTNSNPEGTVIDITRSGRADAWIQFKAAPGQHPILRSTGWGHIQIEKGASYIRIEGLDVWGHSDDIGLAEAQKYARDGLHASTNGNGIIVDGRHDTDRMTQHIEIVGNTVHKCPGGGISVAHADYVTISDNKVFDNSWWSVYDTSGISIWQAATADDAPGYHMIVVRNESYGNRNYIADIDSKTITDGNGIILDDCKNTQGGSKQGIYRGRTLIANNLCYGNGGSGIHVFMSEHADVLNNTCIDNNRSPEIHDGQLFPNSGNDIKMMDNVLVGPMDKPINSNWNNGMIDWDFNLLWGGKGVIAGPHDVKADPMISIERVGDRLVVKESPRSPAIGGGTRTPLVPDDLFKRPRRGKPSDLGCLQMR